MIKSWREREYSRLSNLVGIQAQSNRQRLSNCSPVEYVRAFARQGGVCAICRQPETKRRKATGKVYDLCADHDHVTGKFRGLLCHICNKNLPIVEDAAWRVKAEAYLSGS